MELLHTLWGVFTWTAPGHPDLMWFWAAILPALAAVGETAAAAATAAGTAIGTAAGATGAALGGAAAGTGAALGSAAGATGAALGTAAGTAGKALGAAGQGALAGAGNVAGAAPNLISGATQGIMAPVSSTGNAASSALLSSVTGSTAGSATLPGGAANLMAPYYQPTWWDKTKQFMNSERGEQLQKMMSQTGGGQSDQNVTVNNPPQLQKGGLARFSPFAFDRGNYRFRRGPAASYFGGY